MTEETVTPNVENWDDIPEVEDAYGETIWLDGDKAETDTFVGYYIRTVEAETDLGASKVHRFNDMDGNRVSIWGHQDLNTKLRLIEPGSLVRIQYLETEKLEGNKKRKLYRVQSK